MSLTDEPVRSATKKAVAVAEKAGIWISFDPNLRKPLWKSEALAREQICYGFSHCQILKISDDELLWFTGETDFDIAVKRLQQEYGIALILLSMGKNGSAAYCGNQKVVVPAFVNKNTIETTGAGDSYIGAVSHSIIEGKSLIEACKFATKCSAITVCRMGAQPSMPTLEDVE